MARRSRFLIFLLLLPALLITAVFYLVPGLLTGAMSFTEMNHRLIWEFAGWKNYVQIFKDTILSRVFWNTVLYVFGTLLLFNVSFGLLLALATSYISERHSEKVSLFFRALWLLPRFTPPIVYGVIWLWILDPTRHGLLNGLLDLFGRSPVSWLSEFPKAVIIITNGIIGASFGMILFYSAITSILVSDRFMATVTGAILAGTGSGIVFLNGGSTGGSDIIALIINKYRNITLGRGLVYVDAGIIGASFLIFRSIETMIFGFVDHGHLLLHH